MGASRKLSASGRTMDDLIDMVGPLHSSPTVAYRAIKALEDPDFDCASLEKHLQTDPALAGAIMRLANSSFTGVARHVSSLRQAMALLGARSLRLAVLTVGLVNRLTTGTPAAICREYWRRSLSMAVCASRLSQRQGKIGADEAYMAGLLADIGVLLFAQADTEAYVALCEAHGHGTVLMEAERARYGFDHSSLGAHLLSKWNLPKPLATAVAQHHDDYLTDDGFQRIAFAGSLLAEILWVRDSSRMRMMQHFFLSEFSFDLDEFISFVLACREDISENADVFCAALPEAVQCKDIVEHARRQFETEALQTAVECDSISAWMNQQFA